MIVRLSLVAALCILDPSFQIAHLSIDAIIVRCRAPATPACCSLEVPLAIELAQHWTPTIALSDRHPPLQCPTQIPNFAIQVTGTNDTNDNSLLLLDDDRFTTLNHDRSTGTDCEEIECWDFCHVAVKYPSPSLFHSGPKEIK